MERGIRAGLTRAEGRKFGFTVGAAFLALAGVLWWRGPMGTSLGVAAVGFLLLFAAILVPQHLGPAERCWMALAHVISRVTTPVFLAVVYFLVILPMGLARRTFGSNPLAHKEDNGSFWIERAPGAKTDLHRQF